MNNRTKAVDVSQAVRKQVLHRDCYRCIFCKKAGALTMAHIIPRSAGGLGIAENIVSACSICHHKMDHTSKRETMLAYAQKHVDKFHERTERVFKK